MNWTGMAGILALMAVALSADCADRQDVGPPREWVVRVMNESGEVPAGAEAYAVGSGGSYATGAGWKRADAEGIVRFRRSEMPAFSDSESPVDEKLDVIVRAPGYAASVEAQVKAASDGKAAVPRDVVLEKGMRAEFRLVPPAGKSLPGDLRPSIVDAPHLRLGWQTLTNANGAPGAAESRGRQRLTFSEPESLGGGRYAFRVPENPPALYLLLDAPGFLRQFQAGPFRRTQLGMGPVEVKLPEPGGVEAVLNLTAKEPTGGVGGYSITLVRKWESSSRTPSDFGRLVDSSTTGTTTVRAVDLAPGNYELAVRSPGSEEPELERRVRIASGRVGKTELGARETEQAASLVFPELRIVDESGAPVAGAEIAVRKEGYRALEVAWHPSENGSVVLSNPSDYAPFGSGQTIDGTYEVIVRAPESAWATAKVGVAPPAGGTDAPAPVTIRLPRGRRVELALRSADDRAVPDDFTLGVFTKDCAEQAWWSARLPFSPIGTPKPLLTLSSIEPLGEGRFALSLPDATTVDTRTSPSVAVADEFYLFVNTPGFLRGWQGGPYSVEEIAAAGKLEVELPAPVTVTASFEPPPSGFQEGQTSYTECGLLLALKHSLGTGETQQSRWTELAHAESKDIRVTTTVTDLAPGEFRVEFGTGQRRDSYSGLWSGEYKTTTETAVRSGEAAALGIVFKPFDPAVLKGDFTAVVKVSGAGGRSVEGKPYTVVMQTREHGEKVVAAGTLPASGTVEIPNLRTVDETVLLSEIPKAQEPPSYSFKIGEARLGALPTFDVDRKSGEARPFPGGAKRKEFDFQLPPERGDPAPDIELVDLSTSRTFRLSDLKGQVVFLDFWATWCGPCQKPMEHNQQIMVRRGKEWKGRAQILGASIDMDMETVAGHVQKNKWQDVHQTWCAPAPGEDGGWQTPAARAFSVSGIPTAVLIDRDGKVVWQGHPAEFEVEKEIIKLLSP